MATLATMLNRLMGFADTVAPAAAGARRDAGDNRLRSFANEDIYFFVKRIDNTRVVRAQDPAAGPAAWKMIGTAGLAVLLVIGVLLPSAYGLLAGYRIEQLKAEGDRLRAEQASLALEEARLKSPGRIEELAKARSFGDPAPQKVVYLEDAKSEGKMALNH